jgi:nitroreductase
VTTILDLLKHRVSMRDFIDREVPPDVINKILEAGRLSPSGGNEQPWRFGVITEKSLISLIAELAGQTWIASAPLVIVLCVVPVSDERGGRDIQVNRFPQNKDQIMAMDSNLYHALNMEEHQTKIPGTHMLLAALERGLGGCWVSRFDVRKLADLLNLPADILPSELLILGYPAGEKLPKQKKSQSELTFYNKYRDRKS